MLLVDGMSPPTNPGTDPEELNRMTTTTLSKQLQRIANGFTAHDVAARAALVKLGLIIEVRDACNALITTITPAGRTFLSLMFQNPAPIRIAGCF